LGAQSRRLLMVITQEPTQSLTALRRPGAADACVAGEQIGDLFNVVQKGKEDVLGEVYETEFEVTQESLFLVMKPSERSAYFACPVDRR
jgi:hypothetical protein